MTQGKEASTIKDVRDSKSETMLLNKVNAEFKSKKVKVEIKCA